MGSSNEVYVLSIYSASYYMYIICHPALHAWFGEHLSHHLVASYNTTLLLLIIWVYHSVKLQNIFIIIISASKSIQVYTYIQIILISLHIANKMSL